MIPVRQKIRPLLIFLSIIGPGIITAMVDNDAGGITTYSVAGAQFGYMLLWTLIPVTFILIIVQEMCARLGVVSGKGMADLIRESYGVKITFYLLLGLLAANLATTVAEFSGIAGSLEIFNIPRFVSVPVCGIIIWWVITRGSYRSVEKIALVAAIIYVAYIISGVLAAPNWTNVFHETLKPTFQFSKSYLLVLIGLIGTTITPWMQFYLQASIVEKGVKVEDYRYVKWDVAIGSIVTDIVAFFIIVASAATLFVHGVSIETASDAALALQPFAGRFAEILFAVGLLNASVLGAMIVPLSTSYSMCEGLGFESGVNKSFKEAPWFNGIFTAMIVVSAIPAMFPKVPLIHIMRVSQVINGILLIPVLIFIVLLINKKWLMGKFVNKSWYNAVVWCTVAILIALSLVLVWNSV